MSLDPTPATLLERVRDPRDNDAWREFFQLYYPLIVGYARARGLARGEAEEIAQQCMNVLAGRMSRFRYSRETGRFKNYLRSMVDNHIRNARRGRRPLVVSDSAFARMPSRDNADGEWKQIWLRQHLLHCLERLDARCSDATVKAFKLYCLEGWSVERVCAKLGLSANQVYLAKTRLIRRLRQEADTLLGKDIL